MTTATQLAIDTATAAAQQQGRTINGAASVVFPDFDPALDQQVVAIVHIPTVVYVGNAAVPLLFTHRIMEGGR